MSIKSIKLKSTAADLLPPSNTERAVTVIYLHNSSSSSVTIRLYAVPSDGTARDADDELANIFYGDLTIGGGDTFIVDSEKMLLGAGDGIHASASVDDVVIATISYATL